MKLLKCLKRLWIIGTCTHRNCIEITNFAPDGPVIQVCKKCGRVIDGLPYANEKDNYTGITC